VANIYAYRLRGDVSAICKTTQADRESIHAMLHAANGLATAHTINHASLVSALAHRAEKQLGESGLSLKDRVGARLIARPGGPSKSAYKYRAATTRVEMVRNGVGWKITAVDRVEVYPRQAEAFALSISQTQAATIQERALLPYIVNEE